MTSLASPTLKQALKLASLAVHIEEYLDMEAKRDSGDLDATLALRYDKGAIETLLRDPEVRELLDDPQNKVFLPAKRDERD